MISQAISNPLPLLGLALAPFLAAAVLLASNRASAQDVIGGPLGAPPEAIEQYAGVDSERAAQAAARLEEIRDRLNLTEEQRTAAESILRASFEQRAALVKQARAGGDRPNFRELRRLRGELDAIAEETDAQLAPILTPAQASEWAAIQDELRAEARERIREQRGQ
jgi:hypothetical protein